MTTIERKRAAVRAARGEAVFVEEFESATDRS
jgi:hypothetical protein